MAAKTEVKKTGAAAMMPDVKQKSQTTESKLRAEIAELEGLLQTSECRITELSERLASQPQLIDIATDPIATTRTALLLALAPQINLPHARSEAQRLLVAVDEIMQVWGI